MRIKIPKWVKVLGVSLAIAGAAYASGKYNLIKDNSFENNDPVWKEVSIRADSVDRHYLGGFESDYCGFTDTMGKYAIDIAIGELKQELSKRKINEIDSTSWDYNYFPHPNGVANWGVVFASEQGDTLAYQYGWYGGRNDTTHYKVVKLDYGDKNKWINETRKLGGQDGDWVAKELPLDAVISIQLYSKGCNFPHQNWQGQSVEWDDISLTSTRFDHDAATISAGQQGNVPHATVMNKGAFPDTFDVVYNIIKDANTVYSDTSRVSLDPDSSKDVGFNPYTGQGNNTLVYTVLADDQNTSNDTLSGTWTGIEEVVNTTPINGLRVWPSMTRGLVNYISGTPVKVYNIDGSKDNELPKGQGSFNITRNGVYFLRSGGQVKKVVVE